MACRPCVQSALGAELARRQGFGGFGGFGDAGLVVSAVDWAKAETAAEILVQKTRLAIITAWGRIGISPDNVMRILTMGPAVFLTDWFKTDQQKRAESNLRKVGEYFDKWSVTWRRWARAGKRDDGTPYSYKLWASFAQDLISDATLQSTILIDSSEVEGAIRMVLETAAALGQCALNPAACIPKVAVQIPWWVWAGAAGGLALWYFKPAILGAAGSRLAWR